MALWILTDYIRSSTQYNFVSESKALVFDTTESATDFNLVTLFIIWDKPTINLKVGREGLFQNLSYRLITLLVY